MTKPISTLFNQVKEEVITYLREYTAYEAAMRNQKLVITVTTNPFWDLLAALKTSAMLTPTGTSYFPKGGSDLLETVTSVLICCVPH